MTARPVPAWIRDDRLVASLLVLATLLVQLPAVSWGKFHFDDLHSIVENPGVRTLANVPRYFTEPQLWSAEPGNCMYRPVLLVSFALDHWAWGYNATGWLLTNALVHAAAGVMVLRLARRLGLSHVAALLAGTVFVLHPAISETQNYVSSRSESLAAVLMLAALHLHVSARETGGRRAAAFVAGAFATSFAALLAKETTAAFCVAVGLLELLTTRAPTGGRLLRAAGFGCLYALPLLAFLFLRRHLLGAAVADLALVSAAPGVDAQVGGGRSILDSILTQSRVTVLYLQALARPVKLNVDHDVAVVQTVTASVVAAFGIHISVIAAAVRSALRGGRLFPLSVGWFWCFSIVTFVIPLNVVMNEHRLYLPMIAVALLCGAALARVAELLGERSGSAARGVALAAAPLLCFIPLVVQRSHEWRDDETLWSVAVERAPLSARAHMHLGAVWHERAYGTFDRTERVRLLDAALGEYARSDELHPDWADLQVDIGNARFARGLALHERSDFEAALAAYVKFGEIVGTAAERPQMLQAAAHAELGDVDRAIAIVSRLASLDASPTRLYDDQLARFLRKKGDKRGAALAMERVIAIDAEDQRVDGLLDLGWWCFEDGDLERAQGYIGRAFDVAKTTHDRRPPLYIARFLRLVGQPGSEKFLGDARKFGWTAPAEELRWVMGGATPGVFSGTAGTRAPRSSSR